VPLHRASVLLLEKRLGTLGRSTGA
jgi:hypothetical protein